MTTSVSPLIAVVAPASPSTKAVTTPSAVIRPDALPALLPSLMRRSSSAFSRLPSASVNAFLHSIIGASVFARSSPTMLAVIVAMCTLRSVCQLRSPIPGATKIRLKKRGFEAPSSGSNERESGGSALFDFDELIGIALRHGLDNIADGARAAFNDRIRNTAGIQRDSLRRVVVARDHVVNAFGRMVGIDH